MTCYLVWDPEGDGDDDVRIEASNERDALLEYVRRSDVLTEILEIQQETVVLCCRDVDDDVEEEDAMYQLVFEPHIHVTRKS